MLAFDPMTHRPIGGDVVAVATALAVARETAGGFEVVDDALDSALGDTDLLGKIAQPQLRVASKTDQHVTVVGEERPTPLVDMPDGIFDVGGGSSCHETMLGT